MSPKIARLGSAPDQAGAERRQYPRHSAWGTAKLVSSHGDETQAALVDVSTHGCCVKSDVPWLRAGSFLSIGIEEDEESRLQAIVRWVRDGSAGMEFLHPIPPERSEWHALMDSPFGP